MRSITVLKFYHSHRTVNLRPYLKNWTVGRLILLTSLVIGLAACGGTVAIRDYFPDPVVAPLPYRVGVYYSPEFSSYSYSSDEDKVNFELGSKQVLLFDKVFNAMFVSRMTVSDPDSGPANQQLDMVLVPVLDEYAFLSPAETATNFYTVSIKYHIRVYSADNRIIGYWPFVAYGKNRSGAMSGLEPLGDATVTALRDAAAALVTQFRRAVETEDWRLPGGSLQESS